MRKSISLKIFSVALVVLVLMGIVTGMSAYFLGKIREEAVELAHYFVPIGQHVQHAARQASAHIVHIDRYRSLKRNGAPAARLQQELDEIKQRKDRFKEAMNKARALIKQGIADPALGLDNTEFARLTEELPQVQSAQNLLDETLDDFLKKIRDDVVIAPADMIAMQEHITVQRGIVTKEINDVSEIIDNLTRASANEALRIETAALRYTIGITLIAAIVGLILAALITKSLVRPVQQLVASTQQVRDGNLDVDVRVATSDEISTLADSFNHMVGGLKQRDLIQKTFGKYVDPRIVKTLIGDQSRTLSDKLGDRRRMTMLFSDVERFTDLSERLPPDKLVAFLNHYFEAMAATVREEKGIIDKYIGDSVMAFWGPPFVEETEQALHACVSALAQLQALEGLRVRLPELLGQQMDLQRLNIRIGIATGEVTVGSIGSETQMNYTVVGDAVNLASRLEAANKLYGTRLLIDEATWHMVRRALETRYVDRVRVVGKQQPTRIYEVIGAYGSIQTAQAAQARAFESALAQLQSAGDSVGVASARAAFEDCLANTPHDKATQLMLARIGGFEQKGLPHSWDGVWTLNEK